MGNVVGFLCCVAKNAKFATQGNLCVLSAMATRIGSSVLNFLTIGENVKPFVPSQLPLVKIDWERHVPLIGKANAALARYDGILAGVVNPEVLLSPLTTQEAVLSSRIEGTQASLEEVLQFEANPREPLEPPKYADILEIINYRRAVRSAVEYFEKRPLCLNLIKDLHRILLDSVRGRNKSPGEFRKIQNFIGPPNCTIENATFVPPSIEVMGKALDNWEKYLHFGEKDRLVQLAIAKAQFEIIHPFLDGNGRLGRMLIPLFLFEKGLLSNPMFYLSGYFESHRDSYYQALRNISGSSDWDGWISYFLTAVVEQAKVNSDKAKRILSLYDRMKREIPGVTRSQYAIQAIDALFDTPIFQSGEFIKKSKIPRDSAMRILSALRRQGLVKIIHEGSGRRASTLSFLELIKIAEALD